MPPETSDAAPVAMETIPDDARPEEVARPAEPEAIDTLPLSEELPGALSNDMDPLGDEVALPLCRRKLPPRDCKLLPAETWTSPPGD